MSEKIYNELSGEKLNYISGGARKYIPGGNGAWLDTKTGYGGVDWSIAGPAIGHIIVNGWITSGPLSHR